MAEQNPQQKAVVKAVAELEDIKGVVKLTKTSTKRLETLREYALKMVDEDGKPAAEEVDRFHRRLANESKEMELLSAERKDRDANAVRREVAIIAGRLKMVADGLNKVEGLKDTDSLAVKKPEEAQQYAHTMMESMERTLGPAPENKKSAGRKKLEAQFPKMHELIDGMVKDGKTDPEQVKEFYKELDATKAILEDAKADAKKAKSVPREAYDVNAIERLELLEKKLEGAGVKRPKEKSAMLDQALPEARELLANAGISGFTGDEQTEAQHGPARPGRGSGRGAA